MTAHGPGPLRLLLRRRRGAGARGPGGVPQRSADGGTGARVVLLGRRGCHLCEAARGVVLDVAARTGAGVREVDVDDPGPGEEDGAPGGLAARYGELVPVVLVDGVQHAVYHVDPAGLERALRGPGR